MTEGLTNQNQAGLDAAQSPSSHELMTQDKANYLITKAKESAYEKGMKDAMASSQNQGLTQEQIREIARAEAQDAAKQMQAAIADQGFSQAVVGRLREHESVGRQEYSDFDDVVQTLELKESPQLVPFLADVKGGHHVMYELSKDMSKLSHFLNLIEKKPSAAIKYANEIASEAESGKKQKVEAEKVKAPKPLGQLKPSTTSVGDGTISQSSMRDMIRANRRY